MQKEIKGNKGNKREWKKREMNDEKWKRERGWWWIKKEWKRMMMNEKEKEGKGDDDERKREEGDNMKLKGEKVTM